MKLNKLTLLLIYFSGNIASCVPTKNLRVSQEEEEDDNGLQKDEFISSLVSTDNRKEGEYRNLFESSQNCVRGVPNNIKRTAMQLLQDVSGTKSAPSWRGANFGPCVHGLARPDIRGTAYYEFQVFTQTKQAAGFVVVSNGEHDFPVAHWNFEGMSPTNALLEKLGSKAIQSKDSYTVYKLDSLCYVLEDKNGRRIANIGEMPKRIIYGDQSTEAASFPETEIVWSDSSSGRDDGNVPQRNNYNKKMTGPEKGEMQFEPWTSWSELKEGFSKVYGSMIRSLKEEASEDWKVDKAAAEEGEGLVLHEIYELALLYPRAKYEVEGKGSEMVSLEQILDPSGGRSYIQISVQKVHARERVPFKVNIYYENGNGESLLFKILSKEDMTKEHEGGRNLEEEGSIIETHWVPKHRKLGPWSQWYSYQAGSHWDQRHYNQIPANTSPNTKNCYSGCGATAWAMLFGWADYQAATGNSYWAPRWGLYRYNGGKGWDVAAPKYMDSGVRNMIWEIHNHIDTWCIFGSGATFPWDMDKARFYFIGRTGTKLSTNYHVLGFPTANLRNKAISSIVNRNTPAVIGTGWLQHYPLAYAYRWRKRRVFFFFTQYQRQFYVNQGWGGSGNGWVGASTWFAGQIYPH